MNTWTSLHSVRVLFDETHSESWSISKDKAREISPDYPEYSSYQAASDLLSQRQFIPVRNLDQPLRSALLNTTDILVLLHPCDPRWERTVSGGSPQLSVQEIEDIQRFVNAGGGLLVVSEYEHDKYGDNLNDLLGPFGLRLENHTVLDRRHCAQGNPAWIHGTIEPSVVAESVTAGVRQVCFYQAGSCSNAAPAERVLVSSEEAHPPSAGLLAVAEVGKGRVVVVTDSLLFGDDYLTQPDHQTLWLNLFHWLAVPAFRRVRPSIRRGSTVDTDAWRQVRDTVNQLRTLQESDGSVTARGHDAARGFVQTLGSVLPELRDRLPEQKEYLEALGNDFHRWASESFGKPDFSQSLEAFHPEKHRYDQKETFVLFPLYTPNASLQTRFEALLLSMPWPEWLSRLEQRFYRNDKFAPGHLLDHTDGYASECAVLFPETVSVAGKPSNAFATILCDREARRLQAFAVRASAAVRLAAPPFLECLLSALPALEDTVALWDLIHDRSHSLGELPFDPFMIRQRAPFWMYALEELRVDLRSFGEAMRLASDGFPFARGVPYAILLDRIFRFPIVGNRAKNYDGLAGQLLFAFLHQKEVLVWCDNILRVDWNALPGAVDELRREIASLYRAGATCSKLAFWIEAHDLISKYVKPNVASQWKREARVVDDEADPSKWIGLVQPDEFPLGNFHLNLKKRLGEVRWQSKQEARIQTP